jgi:iron complex outermembrane recepter protein
MNPFYLLKKAFFAPFLCICMVCCAVMAHSQNKIRGIVLDGGANNEPVIGATVLIKGTTIGKATDFNGEFFIETGATKLPLTLSISAIGYTNVDKIIKNPNEEVRVILASEDKVLEAAIVVARSEESELKTRSPVTTIGIDAAKIKNIAAPSIYEEAEKLPGVDPMKSSFGVTVLNTRGFASTSPVRSLQVIDGVDNQAPGLSFALGNFLGSSDLDVSDFNIVVGASSAYYGPNAFNGVISFTTKNPFIKRNQGLSISLKGGERNYLETGVRWADAIKNKNGKDFFAYKINVFALRADDWNANNTNAVDGAKNKKDNAYGWDKVNTYGDEYYRGNDLSTATPWTFQGINNVWHRPGYAEKDIVDYNTRNMKASAALHFKINPDNAESPELILASSFGSGTTVYQGDNRFSLKNILFFQNRIELQKKDKYFIRAYTTRDDAGDSYDPYFTALQLQRAAKSDLQWSNDYLEYWRSFVVPNIRKTEFPPLNYNAATGVFDFNYEAEKAWRVKYNDSLAIWNTRAQQYANGSSKIVQGTQPFFEPGTQRFKDEFKRITSAYRTEGGTRFYDKSALYHVHGEHKWKPSYLNELRVGANARLYTPESKGNIFSDSAGIKIRNFEYGVYGGAEKGFDDNKVRLSATLRVDKNQNYDYLASPAASLIWNPNEDNTVRLSFSSAIRNPTLSDQYLFLNVGRAILAGNIKGVQGLVNVQSFLDYLPQLDKSKLKYFDIAPIRPEKVKSFEVSYRTSFNKKTFIETNYYYSIYNDFIGYNLGIDLAFQPGTNFPGKVVVYRYSANSLNQVTSQGASFVLNQRISNKFLATGNYSWNRLNTKVDDPIIPAFNTPEHKFNFSFSGRELEPIISGKKLNKTGFNVSYKWVQGFDYQGSPQFTGFIPTYDLIDAQVNYQLPALDMTIKIGATNLLNKQIFQTYGGPYIGRLAYISLLYEPTKKESPISTPK